MASESTNIWFNDPSILFKKEQLNQIWPKEGMSRNEKINAITRLVIILTILGYLITQSLNFFITGSITLGVIILFVTLWSSTNFGNTTMGGVIAALLIPLIALYAINAYGKVPDSKNIKYRKKRRRKRKNSK